MLPVSDGTAFDQLKLLIDSEGANLADADWLGMLASIGIVKGQSGDQQNMEARRHRESEVNRADNPQEEKIVKSQINTLALVAAFGIPAYAQELPTMGTVETRLGKLELTDGYPTEATATKLYDDIDFQRACQAYIWALAAVGFQGLHLAHLNTFGAKDGDIVLYKDLKDKAGMLTPNITTIYAMSFWNIDKQGRSWSKFHPLSLREAFWIYGNDPSRTSARPARTKDRVANTSCWGLAAGTLKPRAIS